MPVAFTLNADSIGLVVVVRLVVGRMELPRKLVPVLLRQVFPHVPLLVDLAALDQSERRRTAVGTIAEPRPTMP